MLKKLFKIGMLVSLLALACTANAQEQKEYKLIYPKYGFWSNWSLGGNLAYTWEYEHGGILDFRQGTNLGLRIFLEKELNPVFNLRIIGDYPGLFKAKDSFTPSATGYNRNGNGYDRYFKLGFDAKVSFQGLTKGYDPDRKGNFYFFTGTGLCFSRNDVSLGYVGIYLEGGLGWTYKCSENFTFMVELGDDICGDVPMPIHQWHDMTGWIALGGMYNFGPTQADKDLIAQRALLTQENFDAMANEIDALRKDVRDAKEREAKLINRINELEDQIAHMQPISNNDALVDSLRRVIDGYESNKNNFYAMPFSITYAVDQYTVPADQMNKINAIADILKDNSDMNLEIIGYCDYSGSEEYNQKLSEKRAEYVKKALVRKGIDEDRLTTSGKGKGMPFGNTKNPINRRTSFYRVNK